MNHANNILSAFLEKRKRNHFLFYLVPFVALSIPIVYILLTGGIRFDEEYYSMLYLLNYDHGFLARGLVGEVLTHLAGVVTPEIQRTTILVFTGLWVIGASLCIGRALCKCDTETDRFSLTAFLLLFLCLMSFTTGTCYYDDKLDKFVWALTFFSVFSAGNRILRCIFVPVLSFTAMLSNPIFFFTSMPLIAIIMFDKFQKQHYSPVEGITTIGTFTLCGLLGVYASYAQAHLGFSSPDEFLDFYFANSAVPLKPEVRENFKVWIIEYFAESPADLLRNLYNINGVQWEGRTTTILTTLFVAVPILTVFIWFWSHTVKNEMNKFRKFIFALCPLSLLLLVPTVLLSWEAEKYYGSAILVHLSLLIYFIGEKDPAVLATLDKIKNIVREKPILLPAFFGCYAAIFMVI